jgi:tRNA nucleotidyltransferase/poly(A) polymerase
LSLPSLAGEPWLEAPEVRAVFAALGGEERATRVVGGAVRNALLGQPVTDIDFATILVPAEVTARAEAAGLKTVPTGIDHGTVTLVVGGRPFEVTTLRADVETFGRRAVVRFTGDWAEDAKRRDFTINALYCDADGTIFDPLGAYADIASRRVRFIGSADERIREDYLRILRFFRFFAWYGVGRPDAAGLKAAARHKAGLALLSAERLWAELKKLLAAPDPSRALLWMRTTDILQRVLPESWGIDAIHRLVAAEAAEGRAPDPLLRLEAIMPPHRARIDSLAGRLRLSRAEEARLLEWATAPEPDPSWSEAELAKRLYRLGTRGLRDRLMLAQAREREAGNETTAAALKRQIAFTAGWQRPVFPLKGADLLASGMAPGPQVGRLLKELEQRWIDSGFALSRPELLAELPSG